MSLAKALGSATAGNEQSAADGRGPDGPPQGFRVSTIAAMPVCLISLGSNEGDRQQNLEAAVARMAAHRQIKLLARSSWHETAPIGGPPGQDGFLNGAVTLETSLAPHELLACLHDIEAELGRRRAERWGPRPIDLDLLLYDDLVSGGADLVSGGADLMSGGADLMSGGADLMSGGADIPVCREQCGTFDRQECPPHRGKTCELMLPHPRMAWRRFVLEPAAEVAGSMRHPTIGWSIARLLEHLNDSRPYVAITGSIAAGKTRLAERLARAISGRLISEQPDWARLDAFYADPAGQAWETELTFLDERTRLLAVDAPAWADFDSGLSSGSHALRGNPVVPMLRVEPDDAERRKQCVPTQSVGTRETVRSGCGWTVSDFWFDQSAAFAQAWLPAERLGAFLEQYQRRRPTVVPPRLIILLDAPAEELLARIHRRGRACEQHLTAEQLQRIRQTIRNAADRPDVGPVLQAASNDPEAIFAEVLAAVRGME